MKPARLIATILALLSAAFLYAQSPENEASTVNTPWDVTALEPGLYAVVGDELARMSPEIGTISHSSKGFFDDDSAGNTDFDIIRQVYRYKGMSSINGILPGKFIMVRDPKRKSMTQTLKKFEPFHKAQTPDNLLLIDFGFWRKGREFNGERHTREGMNITFDHHDFTWKQLSADAFEIDATGLPAGEYAFIFRFTEMTSFYFAAGFTFRVE